MYRKRALTVETGPRGEVRYCRPADEARRAAKMSATDMHTAADACAAEVRPAAAEMRRTASEVRRTAAEMRCSAAEVAAAHRMRSAATATVRCSASAAMTPASAASSGARVSSARECGSKTDDGEGFDF